jgi:serine protease Do
MVYWFRSLLAVPFLAWLSCAQAGAPLGQLSSQSAALPKIQGKRQDRAPLKVPVAAVVAKVKPALVFIQELRGKDKKKREEKRRKPVLGVILDSRGTVVTNHSLIKGWKRIEVVLSDGRRFRPKAVFSDPDLDLAVIKVASAKPLKHAEVGDSEKVKRGDAVLALGVPWTISVDESPTAVRGLIGGKTHETKKTGTLLVVETSIGPGCGPGPLFNREGKLVGLVVSRDLVRRGTDSAIPSNRIMERLADWTKGK